MSGGPQLEDGYSRIANEILDVLAKTNLNGTQRRILDVVFRQTYGYQRKNHDLSVSFIANATNMHKKQIQRELTALIEMKIIAVVSEATFNKSRVISFNKKYTEWLNSSEVTNSLPPNEIDTHTGNELAPSTGSELAPQINIKENIKDIIMTSYESEFISVLETIKDYPLDKVKDLAYMKTLSERYKNLDLVEAIKKFSVWVLDNPFKKNANHRSQINTSFGKYVEWGQCLKKEIHKDEMPKQEYMPQFKYFDL
ncbi:hypothetical protein SDC9_59731 [bioreactor metagenome]|uniref:Bacteriophage lambda Replication protein O N-terminal domain-containing protein n=1 Tax=bioreactor metagenome TaxID=1076179 RepID=A0A644XGZ1_9ZZZZ